MDRRQCPAKGTVGRRFRPMALTPLGMGGPRLGGGAVIVDAARGDQDVKMRMARALALRDSMGLPLIRMRACVLQRATLT